MLFFSDEREPIKLLEKANYISGQKEKITDLLIYFIFIIVIYIRYHPVLNSYWLYDDPFILKYTTNYSSLQYFLMPQSWRALVTHSLTPWLPFSLGMDLKIFGLRPAFFYLHHLISLWLVSVMLYAVLRKWAGYFAGLGVLMFLVSAPVAAVTEMLMVRHYIEGLLLCLVALYFFVYSVREESIKLSLLSALFYFLSMSAKELYVPFVVVAFLLPMGKFRRRFVNSIPLAAAALIYFIWRYLMLGDFLAGPGGGRFLGAYKGLASIKLILKNLYGSIIMLAGVSSISSIIVPVIAVLFSLIIGLSLFFILREKKYSTVLSFVVITITVYFIPLAIISPYNAANDLALYRLLFVVAAYLSTVTALSFKFLYGYAQRIDSIPLRNVFRSSIVAAFILLVILIQSSSFLWIKTERRQTLRPMVEEGKFFMTADRDAVLVKTWPLVGGTYYYENLEFFRKSLQGEDSPLVIYDIFAFVDNIEAADLKRLRYFSYDGEKGFITEITDSFLKKRLAYLQHNRKMPFSVSLKVDHGTISFTTGPSGSGRHFLLLGHKPGLYSMMLDFGQQRRFEVRLTEGFQVYARFGLESPDKYIAFSPEWFLDFSKHQEFDWGNND